MALVRCPDCGKMISDVSPSCIGCGRPNASRTQQATDDIAVHRMVQPSLAAASVGNHAVTGDSNDASVIGSYRVPESPCPPAPSALPSRELATRGSRLGAACLDILAFIFCSVPGGVVLALSQGNESQVWLGVGFLGTAYLGLAVTQCILLSRSGQSLGKKAVKIKIVRVKDETNPGFLKVCFLRGFVVGLISAVPYVGWIFGVVDYCFIFRDDRRCIHDLIAETKVVKAYQAL